MKPGTGIDNHILGPLDLLQTKHSGDQNKANNKKTAKQRDQVV